MATPCIETGRLSDQDLIWTNLGGANEITGFTFSGSDANDWSVIFSTCQVTLGPGQDCNLSLSFIPSAPGPRQATVALVDSESPTAVVSLSGVGTVGYYTADSSGNIGTFGDAFPFGNIPPWQPLNAPIVSLATASDGFGYWLAGKDGGVFGFGDAPFFGSMGGHQLNQPIVGIVSTPDLNGYWLVAAGGGIFTFGGAQFYGSMGGHPLNQPVVGMAPSWNGRGYWFVASDGGVFSFGDAPYLGSAIGPGAEGVVGISTTSRPVAG